MRCVHGNEIKIIYRYFQDEPECGFQLMVHGCSDCQGVQIIDDLAPDGADRTYMSVANGGPDQEVFEWLS